MILIYYFENCKTFELWDMANHCKYFSREFKSLKAAKNYCIKNKLSFTQGFSCDG